MLEVLNVEVEEYHSNMVVKEDGEEGMEGMERREGEVLVKTIVNKEPEINMDLQFAQDIKSVLKTFHQELAGRTLKITSVLMLKLLMLMLTKRKEELLVFVLHQVMILKMLCAKWIMPNLMEKELN